MSDTITCLSETSMNTASKTTPLPSSARQESPSNNASTASTEIRETREQEAGSAPDASIAATTAMTLDCTKASCLPEVCSSDAKMTMTTQRSMIESASTTTTTTTTTTMMTKEKLTMTADGDKSKRRGVRILCLDGGGIRGLIEVEILRSLSEAIFSNSSGIQLIKQFDLICGTSTGGILSLALSQGFELGTCFSLYSSLGDKVFRKSFLGGYPRYLWKGDLYSTEYLEQLFAEYLGTAPMRATMQIPMFVVSTDATTNHFKPFLFRSYQHTCRNHDNNDNNGNNDNNDNDDSEKESSSSSSLQPPSSHAHGHCAGHDHLQGTSDISVLVAARATSAAPTFFKPVLYDKRVFVDGGMTANNPTEFSIFEAKRLWQDRPIELVVSLGTGKPDNLPGSIGLRGLLGEVIDVATGSQEAHRHVKRWLQLTMPETAYVRFSPGDNTGGVPLDETDPKILDAMLQTARKYMENKADKIALFKERLFSDGEPIAQINSSSSFSSTTTTASSLSASQLADDFVLL